MTTANSPAQLSADKLSKTYFLARSTDESLRLAIQHHFLKERQGWLIHPTILAALKDVPNPEVADLATGTGIWALDVASQFPHMQVAALDISSAQFVPAWTAPENVKFGIADLLQDAPAQYHGKFDLVHIRLLLSAGPAVDKSIFITHFSQFLRPGGWLQWDELTYCNMHTVRVDPISNKIVKRSMDDHPAFTTLQKLFDMKSKVEWFSPSESFAAAVTRDRDEFAEAWCEYIPVKDSLLKIETDCTIAVHKAIADFSISAKNITDPDILAAFDNVRETFRRETQEEGICYAYNWWVGVGRRPS